MVIIMYNVKFPLFYFAFVFSFENRFYHFWKLFFCEQRSPVPVY